METNFINQITHELIGWEATYVDKLIFQKYEDGLPSKKNLINLKQVGKKWDVKIHNPFNILNSISGRKTTDRIIGHIAHPKKPKQNL